MAFIDPRTGLNTVLDALSPERVDTTHVNSTSGVGDIIDSPRAGFYKRQMLRWRVPMFGWITMFLNPEGITTVEEILRVTLSDRN